MIDQKLWHEEYDVLEKADKVEESPAILTHPPSKAPGIDESQPTATTGNLLFMALMVSLFIVGIGMMTGFFPLTVLGLGTGVIGIIAGLAYFLVNILKG